MTVVDSTFLGDSSFTLNKGLFLMTDAPNQL